jgi:hypothetical protein
MNARMSRAEYDALPFRNDLTNEPLPRQYYRDRYQGGVFKTDHSAGYKDPNWRNYSWWAFDVTFVEEQSNGNP